jgi:hypothetical protein
MWRALETGRESGVAEIAAEQLAHMVDYTEEGFPLVSELLARAVETIWLAHATFVSKDRTYGRSASESALAVADAAARCQVGRSPTGIIDESYEHRLGETPIIQFEVAEQRRALDECRSPVNQGIVSARRQHDTVASMVMETMLGEILANR